MKIRDFFNGFPLGISSVICRKTKKAALLKFFEEIRPVTTNSPLIRFGGDGDGGYLLPDDLFGIDACFSPGVAKTADFEAQIAAKGIRCFMADYSVDSAPIDHPLFYFEKRYLGPTNDGIFMTLENWVNRNAPSSNDLILQMDIEGSEYAVILESDDSLLKRFRILVIEFHNLEDLWQERGYQVIRLSFLKLLKHFEIVHIHPNNKVKPLAQQGVEIPPLLEFTFLRRDRANKRTATTTFPHPLDRQNIRSKKDFSLPSCWYGL